MWTLFSTDQPAVFSPLIGTSSTLLDAALTILSSGAALSFLAWLVRRRRTAQAGGLSLYQRWNRWKDLKLAYDQCIAREERVRETATYERDLCLDREKAAAESMTILNGQLDYYVAAIKALTEMRDAKAQLPQEAPEEDRTARTS